MIESLTHISVSLFALYFGIFAAICIIIGKLWINADGSDQFPIPDPNRFDPIAIAALRGGWKSVIRTAIFSLWNRDLIRIGMDAIITQGKYVAQSVPEQGENLESIEQDIYQFLQTRKGIRELFQDTRLENQIRTRIEPILSELGQLHLLRSASDRFRAWRIALFIALLVAAAGITKPYTLVTIMGWDKFYIGTARGGSVILLIFLLIGALIVLFAALKPWAPLTRLGHRYCKTLEEHFGWVKESIKINKAPEGIDPAFAIAVFGVGLLTGNALYGTFSQAFSTESAGGAGGGCGGCGG